MIYLDNAATTEPRQEVIDKMEFVLENVYGNPSSLYDIGFTARDVVEDARRKVAKSIGAEPDEIFFTSGGTEANNWAIKGTTGGLLVSAYEHHSILHATESEQRRGRSTGFIHPTGRGIVGVRQLRTALTKAVRAEVDDSGIVSVMAAQNELGAINPIRELCSEAHGRGMLFHTDAVQAVGKTPIDVREWGVDLLSASAHKFGGPKGVGFLFSKDGNAPERFMDGGAQERNFRAGTENVAGIVGMAAALRVSCDRMAEESVRLHRLAAMLAAGLCGMFPDAGILGPEKPKDRVPGFISVSIPGHSAEGMLHIFDLKGVAISAGAACNSKETNVSHVLKAIGLSDELASCTLRISLGWENSERDVERILDAFRVIKKTENL